MFPASLTMLPLAPLPALHSPLVSIDMQVVLAALVGAIVLLGGLLAQSALSSTPTRPPARVRALPRHAL